MSPRMRRFAVSHKGRAFFCIVCCAFCTSYFGFVARPSAAQEPAEPPREEVSADVAKIVAEEQSRVQQQIADAGGADASLKPSHVPGFDKLDEQAQEALEALLAGNVSTFQDRLQELADQQSARLNEVVDQWALVRGDLRGADLELKSCEAELASQKHWMSRIGLRNRWMWLGVFIALGCLIGWTMFQLRHTVRRMRLGARSRKLGLSRFVGVFAGLAIVAVVVFVLTGDIGWGVSEQSTVAKNPRSPVANASTQTPQAEPASTGETPAESAEAGWSAEAWQSARSQLQSALVNMQAADRVSDKLLKDASRLEDQRKEIAKRNAEIDGERRLNQMIALGIGWGVVAVVTGSALAINRGLKRKKREIAQTCPLCLNRGTLEPEPLPQGTSKQFQKLVCRNVISTDPPEDCNFNFYEYYQSMTKLCFPTLGHPRAGKTHWLAMVYRELNRGNFSEQIEFEGIKSKSSEEFDRVVDEILESRIDPERTQRHEIPRPLLFNFRDRDRWKASSVLITMFDYSGEVVAAMTLDDSQRRRALEADGYIFFLDPMEIPDPQIDELVRFRQDVKIVKGIGPGEKIHAPIALCVPKIDLLVNHPSAGQNREMIESFYDELAKIDPTGHDISLDIIEARSKLLAPMCGTLWPGWQVEKQIRGLFGGRYKFFPLTPVGLAEPGETNLRNRTIEPFGILEPLLWLLHMNGYPVLD